MASKKIEFILDVNSKPIDVAVDSTLNLKQQFRELQKELNKTKEGTREFELLSAKIGDVKDEMDKTNAKSRDLFGSLSLLPGPVGAFAGQVDNAVGTLKTFTSFSFKDLKFQLGETLNDFKGIASNIGKATGITKIYTTLNNALAASFVKVGVGEAAAATGARAFAAALTATGIGALVVALGLAASALYELATGEKEAASQAEKLNRELQNQNTLLDLNAKDTKRRNAETLARMKAQGATEKQIRDEQLKQAYKDYSDAFDAQQDAIKLYNDNLGKADQKTLENLEKDKDNKIQIAKDYYSNYLVLGYTNRAADNKDQETANQKTIEQNKKKYEKLEQDTKSAVSKLNDLINENAVLAETDARKREDKQLQVDKEKEEKEIKALELKDTVINGKVVTAKELREKLLAQVSEKYRLKENDLKTKRAKEDEDKEKELQDKLNAILEAGENAKLDTMQEGAAKQIAQIEKDGRDKIAKYKEQVAELVKLGKLTQQAADEMIKIFTDDVNKSVSTAIQGVTQKDWLEKFDENLNTFFTRTDNSFEKTKETITNAQDELKKKFEEGAITQTEYTQRSVALENNLIDAKQRNIDATQMLSDAAGQAAQAFGEESAAGKILIKVQQGAALAATGMALADALAGLGKDLKKGFPTNLIAVATTIGLMATAFTQFKNLTGMGVKDLSKGSSGGSSSGGSENLGRNYAEGGMIEGPRHAQGGVMIEAEGGEAIMTRGAVTAFAPLLSMMNQIGGGTSFSPGAVGGARPDAPLLNNPSVSQQPSIMKTYVVSNELTTEVERQARLKDLSTL